MEAEGEGRRGETGHRFLFAACCLLLVVPILSVHQLPMVDLPQHAAQVAVLHRWSDPAFGYPDLLELNFFTPYLLGYGLAWLLSLVLPVAAAFRVLVALAVVAVPLAVRSANVAAGGRREWEFLGFPVAFGFAFSWGFLNFLLGIPLAIWFVLGARRYAERPTLRGGLLLGACALGLFWCHVMITALCCLIGGLLALSAGGGPLRAVLRALPFASPAPLAVAWLLRTGQSAIPESLHRILDWGPHRLLLLGAHVAGSPAVTLDAPRLWIHLAVGLAVLAVPFLGGARPDRRLRSWIPLATCVLLYLFVPHVVRGQALTYPRFGVFLLPFLLLALRPGESRLGRGPAVRALPTLLALAWLAFLAVSFARFDRETRDFREVLDRAPAGKRAVSLVFDRSSEAFPGPVYLHFAAWYQVEKGGLVEFSFSEFPPVLARFRPDAESLVPVGQEWYPHRYDWARNRGDRTDLFFLRSRQDRAGQLLAGRPVRLLAHCGTWWLYERIGP